MGDVRPTLPPELVEIIVGFCNDDEDLSQYGALTCRLVCRTWLAFARPRCLQQLDFNTTNYFARSDALIDILRSPVQTLSLFIHTLSFIAHERALVLIPAFLRAGVSPSLVKVHFVIGTAVDQLCPALSDFHSTKELRVRWWASPSDHDVLGMVSSLPQLERLVLCPAHRQETTMSHFPQLSTRSLQSVEFQSDAAANRNITRWLAAQQSLQLRSLTLWDVSSTEEVSSSLKSHRASLQHLCFTLDDVHHLGLLPALKSFIVLAFSPGTLDLMPLLESLTAPQLTAIHIYYLIPYPDFEDPFYYIPLAEVIQKRFQNLEELLFSFHPDTGEELVEECRGLLATQFNPRTLRLTKTSRNHKYSLQRRNDL